MRTETVEITPALASQWLVANNNNRMLSPNKAKQYARDMMAGNWSFTHQGIAFYENGDIADGQHRLKAIEISGMTCRMLVTHGVEVNAGADIDTHRMRDIGDSIRIGGLSDWIGKMEVAIIRAMSFGNTKTSSAHQLVAIGEEYKSEIQFALNNMRARRKHLSPSYIFACVALAYRHENHDRLAKFCDVFLSGVSESIDDVAAIRLREYLLSNGSASFHCASARADTALRIQRAIKAFCNKERISKLYAAKELIYTMGNAPKGASIS